MIEIAVPVLIIGAGPAGLSATILLSQYGVKSLTITRHAVVANSPRAHITNQRTMEIFRQLGIEERVKVAATPNHLMENNVWAVNFSGLEIARLQAWGTGEDRKADYETASPCEMCNIPQLILDPILLDAAIDSGGHILFNTQLIKIEQSDAEVIAHLIDRISGEEIRIRAQYAIGADGSNSLVAKEMGFELDGEMDTVPVASCWLEADLTQYCKHRPGVLYWLMTKPDVKYGLHSATFTCVRPWTEWVMAFGIHPDLNEQDLSHAAMIDYARTAIGVPDIPVKIKSLNKWKINNVAAKSMQKGRVFLAGDAAHRHPPTNGLGTNTSIQDSFNLAWKLALVLQEKAAPSLLDTYSVERQPVARQVVDRAMKSMRDMQPISDAIEFHADKSPAAYQVSLSELLSDSTHGRKRRSELEAAIKLQNYQFNCHGVELGQTYASAAIIADGTEPESFARDAELYYHPSTFPGAPLPHAWLERNCERISTLDLVKLGRFALLTGMSGTPWKSAAAHVSHTLDIEFDAYTIGVGCEINDPYGAWARQRGVQESGCVLVRPDCHVMWRSQRVVEHASELLLAVMTSALWNEPAVAQRNISNAA